MTRPTSGSGSCSATSEDLRLVQVTTLESPLAPYVGHYPLVAAPAPDPDRACSFEHAEERRPLDAAVGDADEETRCCYRWILLDSLVHEFNALRGALGEPDEIRSAQLSRSCVSVNLRFGETDCHLSWVDLPGIARYKQEFAFYAPDQRLTLELPVAVPAQHARAELIVEGGEPGTRRQLEPSRDRVLRRGVQAGAHRVRRVHRHRARAANLGRDGLADLRLRGARTRDCGSTRRTSSGPRVGTR